MLNHKSKEDAAVALAEDKACARLAGEGENHGSVVKDTVDLAEVKKKKKKRKKDKESDDGIIEPDHKILKVEDTSDVVAELIPEPVIKRKKSKKREREDDIENEESQEEAAVIKEKKSKKSKKSEEPSTNEPILLLEEEEVEAKEVERGFGQVLKGFCLKPWGEIP